MQDQDDNSRDIKVQNNNVQDNNTHMNEPTREEQALSALYATLSQEQPPEAMDEKILEYAHDTLAADVVAAHASFKRGTFNKPASKDNKFNIPASPFSGRWIVPTSLAAVIVLSIALITVIEKQRPYSITGVPDTVSEQQAPSNSQAAERNEADRSKEKFAQKATDSPQSVSTPAQKLKRAEPAPIAKLAPATAPVTVSEQAVPQRQNANTEKDQLARKPAVITAQSEPPAKPVAKSTGSIQSKPQPTPPPAVTPQVASNLATNESRAAAAVENAGTGTLPQAIVAGKSAQPNVNDQSQSALGQIRMEQQQQIETKRPILAKKTENPPLTAKQEAKPETLAAAAESAPPQPTASADTQSTVQPVAGQTAPALVMPSETTIPKACYLLSASDCLQTNECTLHWNGDAKRYQCLKNANTCEENFIQATANPSACKAKPGCKFEPANCYCPPDTRCDCAAGPPAMCVPIKK